MRFNIETNIDAVISDLTGSTEQALRAAADELSNTAYSVEKTAKENIKRNKTVDTGRLLGSISTNVKQDGSGVTAEVGTNVEYANYIEYGTCKMGAKPFLNPAFEEETEGLENRIRQAIRDAFR